MSSARPSAGSVPSCKSKPVYQLCGPHHQPVRRGGGGLRPPLAASRTTAGNYGIYFALFGFAAIFLFSSYNMMPTARNNNSAIMKRADRAEAGRSRLREALTRTVRSRCRAITPTLTVLKQMMDAVEEGRAVTVPEALEAVKNRLREVNADVQVEQEEYDEIVQIKAMFLNHDYAVNKKNESSLVSGELFGGPSFLHLAPERTSLYNKPRE